MADCCLKQGAYHLATKKYTQAGNKLKVAWPHREKKTHFVINIDLLGDEGALEVARYREDYFLCERFSTERDFRHGGELSPAAGVAKGSGNHEAHHIVLHQRKGAGSTFRILRRLCSGERLKSKQKASVNSRFSSRSRSIAIRTTTRRWGLSTKLSNACPKRNRRIPAIRKRKLPFCANALFS